MDKYPEDDEILNTLEHSEDDESESGVGVHHPMTERATISVLKNCQHLKCQILMMIAKT